MQGSQAKFLAFQVYRSRDADAYKQLYRAYVQTISRFLSLKLPRPEDVDETTSEVFLRGWEYMTANLVDNPRGLFMKVAHNLVADFYRAAQAHKNEALNETHSETIAAPGSLADDIAEKEATDDIIALIRKLKEEYRDVLLLRYVDERTVEEIAALLGKTPNNIRVLLFRAKRALKKL